MWNTSGFSNGTTAGFENQNHMGGGFLNSPGNFGSPVANSQGEGKKSDRLQNLVPCTIAQLLQTPEMDEHLKIGSMMAHTITIVGMVVSVDEQSTRITYQVDDMTSRPIEVQMWLGESEEFSSDKRTAIVENTYIRVNGSLRNSKGKRHLVAFKVTPVIDANEITMHFLEVIHTSMAVAVMDKQADAPPPAVNANNNYASMKMDTSYNTESGDDLSNVIKGLTKPQKMVYQAIAAVKTIEGCEYNHLCSTLKTLSKQVIRDSVEFLSNEGHIYSTVDEEHFKATDCN